MNKELWKIFVGWNKGHFWASEKNIKRNFSFSAMEYLKNRILARRLLDTSTNAERSSNSARIQTEKRRMTKNRVSTRTIQKLTKQAFEGLSKESYHYKNGDKTLIIQHFLGRCGKAGEVFLGNSDNNLAVTNVQAFFTILANKHSAQNIQGAEIVKASLSGTNIEPRRLRKLVAPTSRLEGWQKARDRRVCG